ncbi:CehA/McbA family metallohydrolase [Fibrella sp. HMF5036]|uniref:CehA/McbA family metallohydrolase n=2 Tax=Fibrella aquatilis TaxID=2817059 RepID=A0A939G7K4_9BACT|nr:CehA/McbA family metallohydrolase [Fibrella aquatilis]
MPKTGLGATAAALPVITNIDPQPLLAQALRLQQALSFLGSSLAESDANRLKALQQQPPTAATIAQIQAILDPYCLAMVTINPEARVTVQRGPAPARLMQGGWTSFLVKVHNEAHATAELQVDSPNAQFPFQRFEWNPNDQKEKAISAGQVAQRFLEVQLYKNRPLLPSLSGLLLEYAVVQVYSKDRGQREAQIGFNIGQGSQDIGFRNVMPVLFTIAPAVKVVLRVRDHDGTPTMASFVIADGIQRTSANPADRSRADFRLTGYAREFNIDNAYLGQKSLTGIYPLPSRRVAETDEYPDFYFHPQVYRADGEHVFLPPGTYTVTYTRGPEYLIQAKQVTIPEGVDSTTISFDLTRWIHLASLGFHSADHHIHAAGCSHYEMPQEGVNPQAMWRQILGEDLNIGSSLAWGPSWYHQKTFFTGKDESLSNTRNRLRNDVEISGFPSSDSGHLVLLRLKEDDYPGTKKIQDWPTWTLPIMQWAKAQGGAVGYAHSGWGLEPVTPTKALPYYEMPKMDGIGANEFIVTVTQNVVDFYSAGDTPPTWELTMWYHSLNSGFRPKLSGETDFPCIFDERVGLARSYFKTDGPLSYDGFVEAIKKGRAYVSEGHAHLMNFAVNGQEVGINNSQLTFTGRQTVTISATAAAYLPERQDSLGAAIARRDPTQQPYWHIERARVGTSRKVAVELIVNGFPVDTAEIVADGKLTDVRFSYPISRSSWVALRVYPGAHTNPVFIEIGGKPIAEPKSIDWCLKAVDQCWRQKAKHISAIEKPAAEKAYEAARQVYRQRLQAAGQK